MYYAFSALTGVLMAIMIVANGGLTEQYGLYSSTVFIHLAGLVFIVAILAIKKEKKEYSKKIPLYLYLGGAIGVVTVIFNNQAFGKISVSAILALCLLGQSMASIVIDQFGLLNMPKQPLVKKKLIGIAIVFAGIVWMLLPLGPASLFPVLFSFASGLIIAVSRTLNARLAEKNSVLRSTFFNYLIGFVVSAAVLLVMGRQEPLFTGFQVSPNIFIYCGGLFGVIAIAVSNLTVIKISAFYMTLFQFVGQVMTGIAADMLLTQSVSAKNIVGGICVALGLVLNLCMEQRKKEETDL